MGKFVQKTLAAAPPADNPLEFVMSDNSVDRMGDVIEQDGWQLANFVSNPIALFGHAAAFPIGRWRDVRVVGNRLLGRLELMPAVSERLREIHAAVTAGVLRAVSVGFHAVKYEPLEGSKAGGYRFLECELVECSLVSVPANPNALQVARGLSLSDETRSLIFDEYVREDGEEAGRRTPTPTGELAGREISLRKKTPMQISEKIQSAQTELIVLRDQLSVLEDDDDEKEAELTSKIEEVKNQLARWQRRESALGDTSEPIMVPASRTTVIPPGSGPIASVSRAPKPWMQHKKKEEEPGFLFIRHCVVEALHHLTRQPREAILADRYGKYADFEVTKEVVPWFQRAASAPATTTTAGWAAELAQTQYGEYFDALMPSGIYRPLASRGFRATLGRFATISMPTRQATPTVAGSFVAEGAPIPVRQAAFTAVTLGLKKMAVIVSYTRELAEHSTPQIEQIIRELIAEDTQVSVDTSLIDANAATAIRPAGLRNGVTVTTATAGGGFDALVGDVKNLVGVLAAANSLRSPVWIMNNKQATAISLTQNNGGDFPFRQEINSSTLVGYPVILSTTMPAQMVILLDAADFMTVTGDDPRFDVSDQATLHYEDTTPLQISTVGTPNVVAAPVRNLYQTDSLALRMILPMNWAMRRTGVIAWTENVTW